MSFHRFPRKNEDINNATEKGGFESYSTSPSNVLRILILEKRELVLEAIMLSLQSNKETVYFRSSLFTMFQSIRNMLDKDLEPDKLKKLRGLILNGSSFESLLNAFEEIEDYLYKKGLTKIDYGEVYDSTDATAEDEKNGL